MIARIIVTPKKSVLDPQGEAVRRAIHTLGLAEVTSTRVGKYIELEISGSNVPAIRAKLEEISRDLLSNPVVEDYHLEIDAAAPAAKTAPEPAKAKAATPAPAPVVKDGKSKPAKAVEVKTKTADVAKKVAKKSETKVAKTVSKKK